MQGNTVVAGSWKGASVQRKNNLAENCQCDKNISCVLILIMRAVHSSRVGQLYSPALKKVTRLIWGKICRGMVVQQISQSLPLKYGREKKGHQKVLVTSHSMTNKILSGHNIGTHFGKYSIAVLNRSSKSECCSSRTNDMSLKQSVITAWLCFVSKYPTVLYFENAILD